MHSANNTWLAGTSPNLGNERNGIFRTCFVFEAYEMYEREIAHSLSFPHELRHGRDQRRLAQPRLSVHVHQTRFTIRTAGKESVAKFKHLEVAADKGRLHAQILRH